jgi:hypothetical protein
MFVLCGNSVLHTRIPNIAVYAHQDHKMEVATRKFLDVPVGTDMTWLESSISFLQTRFSMRLQERIWQARHEIC